MIMPKTPKEHIFYWFFTVLITVSVFIFYSVYFVQKSDFWTIINSAWVPMLWVKVPLFVMFLTMFLLALILEMTFAWRFAHKIADKMIDAESSNPFIVQTVMTCCIMFIMCPIMSFFASILFYNYSEWFNFWIWFVKYFSLLCYNFLFAFFAQLFFIQPFMMKIFSLVFYKKILN